MQWTDKELRFIRDNYKKLGATEIVERLNLSDKLSHPENRVKNQYRYLKRINFKIPPYYSKIPYKFPNLTQYELGYIAGFLDGEGSLAFSCTWRGGRPKPIGLRVDITNLDPMSIKFIHKILKVPWGLRLYDSKPRGQATALYFSGTQKVKEFLENITPYLILKKEQAEIILKFIKQHKRFWTLDDWELVLKQTKLKCLTHPGHLARIAKLEHYIERLKS